LSESIVDRRCSCGHVTTEHAIAAGLDVYNCEAATVCGRVCGCDQYTPQPSRPVDLEIDEELPWRAA
jgi:hypothetical protein